MTAIHFMNQLKNMGLNLYQRGGQLHYKCPKGLMTPQLMEKIRARKGEILSMLIELERIREGRRPPIRNVPNGCAHEKHQDMANHRSIYEGWLLHGPLDLKHLECAFQELIGRHDLLRHSYITPGLAPEAQITVADLRNLPRHQSSRKSAEIMHRFGNSKARHKLAAVVVHLDCEKQMLLLKLSSALADNFSLNIIREEWAHAYNRLCAGQSTELPTMPISYCDITHWQQFNAHAHGRQLIWWQHRLAGLSVKRLGQNSPQRMRESLRIGFAVDPLLVSKLQGIAACQAASLFMVILAAWKIWLHGAGAGNDLAVATQVDHRPFPEMEDLVGKFGNLLILRTDLSGNPNFRQLLTRVRKTALEAYSHSDIPYRKVAHACRGHHEQTRLFQSSLIFQHAPAAQVTPVGISIERLQACTEPPCKEDLSLLISHDNDRLQGALIVAPGLFTKEEARVIPKHFLNLLQKLADHPNWTLQDFVSDRDASMPVTQGFSFDASSCF